MSLAMDAITDRITGLVLAKLRSPKVRRGTRFWTPSSTHTKGGAPAGLETKALDADSVVPDGLVAEIEEAMRPVALRVAVDAASDVAARLGPAMAVPTVGPSDDGMFAVDGDLLGDLVDEALADLLGVAERYVGDIRQAVLDADADTELADDDIDALIAGVEHVAQVGAGRLRLDARTMGTSLAAQAQIEQAKLLGVGVMQWISRRDERVRHTHRVADGQQREIGDGFRVGKFLLKFPGDPSGLPVTAGEVIGCRCGLLFARPDERVRDSLALIAQSEAAALDSPGVDALLAQLPVGDVDVDQVVPVVGAAALGLPGMADAITAPADVVGWRLLTAELQDVVPGQRVTLPEGTVLGLAAPRQRTAATVAVRIPAGTRVGVTGGTIVLLADVVTSVLAVSSVGLQLSLD